MAIRLEREGAVGVIVLDRPPANSYDYDLLRELGAAVDDARFDEGVREVFRKFENTPMLFVAAIAGHALGGGLELALACDLRFAARGGYRIGLPEVTLGLFPGSGGTQRLPRLVGLAKGLDLIVTGRAVSPEEAHGLGVVDQLFDDAAACRAAAVAYCAKVAEGPAEAIGRAKVATTLGYGAPLDLGLAIEREAIARVFVSEDAQEGIAAFSEKRQPSFKGR
jgi:enoyl-CoA hydratase/carnithine racemase